MRNWYNISLEDVDTPALLVDHELVQSNIESAIEFAGGVDRLRPHVKTHKILEVAKLQRAAGIYKFKCATIPEAEMLGMADAKAVLIAYQPQGPKVKRVLKLTQKYPGTSFSVLVDNVDSARYISEVFESAQSMASIYIDVNDGHDRTGIQPQHIPELFDTCAKLNHLTIEGLHCYDGHIRMSSLDERVKESKNAFKSVIDLKSHLEEKFDTSLNMVAGGSPSFSVHARHHDVECSPGTWIFWDKRYASDYKEQPFQIAAVVATRVISQINEFRYCLDLGHKSIASEFPFPRVKFITDLKLTQVGHSEEHLVVTCDQPNALKVGQLLLGMPYHICPTVALYDEVHVIKNGEVADQWKVIARDRKITI